MCIEDRSAYLNYFKISQHSKLNYFLVNLILTCLAKYPHECKNIANNLIGFSSPLDNFNIHTDHADGGVAHDFERISTLDLIKFSLSRARRGVNNPYYD